MLFQNLKAIGEELSEICVLFCKYIYIFIYIDEATTSLMWKNYNSVLGDYLPLYTGACFHLIIIWAKNQ
jgi:hypothetical protein